MIILRIIVAFAIAIGVYRENGPWTFVSMAALYGMMEYILFYFNKLLDYYIEDLDERKKRLNETIENRPKNPNGRMSRYLKKNKT